MSSIYIRFLIVILSTTFTFQFKAKAEPLKILADVKENVATDFGVYKPYPIDVEPNVQPYVIDDNFSNISNFSQFTFNSREKELLKQNGFVATQSGFKTMYDIYNKAKTDNAPIFVTVDALLHTYHELFDYILRTIEEEKLINDLKSLTASFLEGSQNQWEQATEETVKKAALKNIAFFSVASKLLEPTFDIPVSVSDWVEAELNLIDAHQGMKKSPIFNYFEDYSQYLPRGHYTLSEELKRFFRAMMWYGRINFNSKSHMATRQALLITQLMNSLEVSNHPVMEIWERIYNPTVFFVGQSDDLTIYQYTPLMKEIYGTPIESINIDQFTNEAKLNTFLNRVASLPFPQIDFEAGQGFRFMGQRFIPDSYMFTQLVIDRTSRLFPRGLDVMAVLGSSLADQILDEIYNETEDDSYVAQMEKLKTEFAALEESEWVQNLYWNWLYCLMPLLSPKREGFPTYMQSAAWQNKELGCALGSWAELRHDTILYAKQSYTRTGIPPYNADGFSMEWVEPNPWAFARLASLARFTIDGLGIFDLLLDDFEWRLQKFHDLLLTFKDVAIKELTNVPLSIQERRTIREIGETLANLSYFGPDNHLGEAIEDDMAVIADVHTDILVTNQVLEVGVGYPLNLYVVVGKSDNLAIAMGSAFSYYELRWPMDDRLTDEAWREILSSNSPPEQPEWYGAFMDLENRDISKRFFNAEINQAQNYIDISLDLTPSNLRQGQNLTISVQLDVFDHPEIQVQVPSFLELEILIAGERFVFRIPKDQNTPDPYDYIAEIDTTGWPVSEIKASVYSPSDIAIYKQGSIELQSNGNSVKVWSFY